MTIQLAEHDDEQFRANRFDLISRLADDLAHEIKNPLNAIIINLEVLKVRVVRGDADAALDRAAVIEHETRRLHGLIDRVLQLLRPTRSDLGSMALDQTLDELLPLFDAQTKLARNQFRCDGAASVFVAVARDRFKFALLNLLTATHERLGEGNGSVVLTCEVVDDVVRLSVRAVSDGAPLPADTGAMTTAIAMTRALLGSSGVTLETSDDSVTVVLPRGIQP